MPAVTTAQKQKLDQQEVSGFLYAELLHTLGAYKVAGDELEELRGGDDSLLLEMITQARNHNHLLRDQLHHPNPAESSRHPSPLLKKEKGSPNLKDSPDLDLLAPIQTFYEAAARALSLHLENEDKDWDERTDGEKLGKRLAHIHDPQRRNPEVPARPLVKGRLERIHHRLKEVRDLRGGEVTPDLGSSGPDPIRAILHDCLSPDAREKAGIGDSKPLHLTILEAMSEAHRWMHRAEHLRSQPFGEMFTSIAKTHAAMTELLDYSRVLNTFVYTAARSVPWVFAENGEEREQVVRNYEECCETLTPTYCMWIGNQLSLLALERRGYTRWTQGHDDRAYCDFHKLIRLLRALRRQVTQQGTRVPGTKTLIEGLTATAEHHIGRIYRGQHAHRMALRYFDRAAKHLKGWEDHPEIGHILKDSRWRVDLLISRGKANYELGRMKASLTYYSQAWRAFLQLAENESDLRANLEVVDELIEWLGWIADEPELGKLELSERLLPLVAQFETVYSPVHLRVLAADLMMRIGHLLYVLKLPPQGPTPHSTEEGKPPLPDHELARRCMFQAAELDQRNTLIASDLLKIRHGARLAEAAAASKSEAEEEKPLERVEKKKSWEIAPPAEQWPSGGDRFEEAVRVFEYVIQTWLEPDRADNGDESEESTLDDDALIAHELLRTFLAHTDSSNVKLAQVYRYLMQKPHQGEDDPVESGSTIDLVCLRRYSSFFPFLPRPAAFRALGGGYLALVREGNEGEKPFGIAIDPGIHFIFNLYCCGYSLADIDMIVLTHDHADHIASLDALLALISIRKMLGDDTFGAEKRLTIVGNKSVVERYRFFNLKHPVKTIENEGGKREQENRNDVVRVMSFAKFHRLTTDPDPVRREATLKREGILRPPQSLRIAPIKTVAHFDARGYVSQGFTLSVGIGPKPPSILFTSDTGRPPSKEEEISARKDGGPHFAGGRQLMRAVAAADVVVAHLSSVPLPELRKLGDLPASVNGDGDLTRSLHGLWTKAAAEVKSAGDATDDGIDETRFLLRQLQFAFRSRGEDRTNLDISPFSPAEDMQDPSEKHLYLSGLLAIAKRMRESHRRDESAPLLLIGELREELGSFRTRIADHVTKTVFKEEAIALTTDIGLRVRISQPSDDEESPRSVRVLCTTCDLDNDLIAAERFHPPNEIREVCVKGENEGVFYNCELHDPGKRPERLWIESVERYSVFGD